MLKALRSRGSRSGERGTVLLLFPAAILIVLLLGSIAVDFSLIHLRHQEVEDLAASAANDAAHALSNEALYDGGTIALTAQRAAEAVVRTVAIRGFDGVVIDRVDVTADAVTVSLHLDVEYLLAPVVPGAGTGQRVTGTATARLLTDTTP